jgi:hypothetical protein
MKDNLSAGSSWSETKNVTISGNPATVNMTYTVVGNKFDTSFNGNTFKDCIRIKVNPDIGFPFQENNIWYLFAKNVGMIANKVRLKFDLLAVNVDTQTKLETFVIK